LAVRVHTLAKELGVKSKAIVEKCQAEGLDVKNHMSVLSAGLEATIREWFSEGEHTTTEETTARVDLRKVRRKPRKAAAKKKAEEAATAVAEATEEAPPTIKAEAPPAEAPEAERPKRKSPAEVEQEAGQVSVAEAPAEEQGKAVEPSPQIEPQPTAVAEPPVETIEEAKEVEKKEEVPASEAQETVEEAEAPAAGPAAAPAEPPKPPEPVKPAGPANVPAPAKLQGPRVVRIERPEEVTVRPRRPARRASEAAAEISTPVAPEEVAPGKGRKRRVGGKALTEAEEKAARKARALARRGRGEVVERIREWRDRDLIERSERVAAATDHPELIGRKAEVRRPKATVTAPRKTKVQLAEPIIMKDFCAAIGVPFNRVFPKLMEHGEMATINQAITAELAEMLALEFDVEVEIVRQKSGYERLEEQFRQRPKDNVKPRPPVVTFLGHVDHGKTSLLDAIRNTRVVSGEAGGITQHIGAYRYRINDRYVAFLDTPGHEAFTALRARGANMTDIVVLVVAADDGVMPQTVEAISHAKAANVAIVVAMNKIDLPNADPNKVLGQLAEHGLTPAEWGGEIDVIRTSAITGEGIKELVEHLDTLAELLDLKAQASGPATGVVIEASMDPSRGPIANLMVQEGELKVGDVVVAGTGYGRVRSMVDDLGQNVKAAYPATPVSVLGLDQVPEAGDRFYVIEDLQQAQSIVEEKRAQDRASALAKRPRVTLDTIFGEMEAGTRKALNLIVKADVQGSVDVLTSKLGELGSDEVSVRVLHAGVGGISEGDVLLADASEAAIIGFGVVPEDRARELAQKLGIEIRVYTVIYELLDDLTKALEGMLEPTYEQKILGRARVREVFRISRVGTVAGCIVNEGTITRDSKVRIIRQNVIIREEAALQSLRRFKDDVREVRQGLECGIKIAGFDDVKVGDVIEAYEMVEVARKL